jgi:hypothetical protein
MISRKTALRLSDIYYALFTRHDINKFAKTDELYDYLYERDYEAWFCNLLRKAIYGLDLKGMIMQLHTGESLVAATNGWDWDKRKALGQTYLCYLAEDALKWLDEVKPKGYLTDFLLQQFKELIRLLELDGYLYRDGSLMFSEADVLNLREETGILESLYSELKLADREVSFEFLRLSEEHYKEEHWADSIANSRKFLESVLQQVARAFSKKYRHQDLSEEVYSRPVDVREYLVTEKLLEKKEREALDKVYGLLSHTGSHPYMAEKDQARLLRQMSLLFCQFVMLRFEGRGKSG